MAQIDSPPLGDSNIEIIFDRPIFTVSKISKSINRTEMQNSYLRADILYSERAISIIFTRPLEGARERLELRVSCEPLALQMSSTAQICKSLSGSALLLGVEDLYLSVKRPPSYGQDDSERKHWLEIIYHFRGTKWLHVAGDYSTNIVLALQLSNSWRDTLLPALHKLYIQEPEQPSVPFQEAVLSFTHSYRLSSNFIGVEYEQQRADGSRGTGITYTQCVFHQLTCFEQDLLLRGSQLSRSATTSFSKYFFTTWRTLQSFGLSSYRCAKTGDKSYFHHPGVCIFNSSVSTERLSRRL